MGVKLNRPSYVMCVLSRFSHVWLFETLWAVACQTPVYGILQARILERVAMPPSRGPSWLRDWIRFSCNMGIVGRFFITEPPGSPYVMSLVYRLSPLRRIPRVVCSKDQWLLTNSFKVWRSHLCNQLNPYATVLNLLFWDALMIIHFAFSFFFFKAPCH